MPLTADTKGVFAIAPTPFLADGSLDHTSIDTMVAFYERCGVDGLTIFCIMGEALKLDAGEALDVVKRVLSRFRKLVIVGVSATGLCRHARADARASMERGAAGVMIAPPPTLRTDDQIVGYYSQAAEAIGADVPFVLQDYPLTLSVQL